jgi:hypothetical protein
VLGSGTTVPVIFTYVEKFGGNGGPGEVRRTNLPDEIDSYMRWLNSHPAHLPTANLPQLRRTGGRCKNSPNPESAEKFGCAEFFQQCIELFRRDFRGVRRENLETISFQRSRIRWSSLNALCGRLWWGLNKKG